MITLLNNIRISRYIPVILFFIISYVNFSFTHENVATNPGFPADSRLLIINADDLGVSYSENIASIKAIEKDR